MAAFDEDARKAGATIDGIRVYPHGSARRGRRAPADSTGDDHGAGGRGADRWPTWRSRPAYRGIVNFAPVTLSVPEDVSLVGVDLATELEQISFSVANRLASR